MQGTGSVALAGLLAALRRVGVISYSAKLDAYFDRKI